MFLACSSVLPLDIGAHHSGFLFGLSSMATSLGSILNPLAIGFIVKYHVGIDIIQVNVVLIWYDLSQSGPKNGQ